MIDWVLFVFYDFLWWAGNWMLSAQKYEGFPCDNPGLARSPYVKII